MYPDGAQKGGILACTTTIFGPTGIECLYKMNTLANITALSSRILKTMPFQNISVQALEGSKSTKESPRNYYILLKPGMERDYNIEK